MISCCFKNDMKTNFTLGSESSTWYVIKNCKIKHEACCYHHMMNLTSFLGSSRANLWRKAQVRLEQQLCTIRFIPTIYVLCTGTYLFYNLCLYFQWRFYSSNTEEGEISITKVWLFCILYHTEGQDWNLPYYTVVVSGWQGTLCIIVYRYFAISV